MASALSHESVRANFMPEELLKRQQAAHRDDAKVDPLSGPQPPEQSTEQAMLLRGMLERLDAIQKNTEPKKARNDNKPLTQAQKYQEQRREKSDRKREHHDERIEDQRLRAREASQNRVRQASSERASARRRDNNGRFQPASTVFTPTNGNRQAPPKAGQQARPAERANNGGIRETLREHVRQELDNDPRLKAAAAIGKDMKRLYSYLTQKKGDPRTPIKGTPLRQHEPTFSTYGATGRGSAMGVKSPLTSFGTAPGQGKPAGDGGLGALGGLALEGGVGAGVGAAAMGALGVAVPIAAGIGGAALLGGPVADAVGSIPGVQGATTAADNWMYDNIPGARGFGSWVEQNLGPIVGMPAPTVGGSTQATPGGASSTTLSPDVAGTGAGYQPRPADAPDTQFRPAYPLSEADLSAQVINTIAGEAHVNDQESVDAVINNMMNRVGSKGWGPSGNLQEVARAPGQYEGYRTASEKETAFIQARIKAIASGQVPDNTDGANSYRMEAYYQGTKGQPGKWATTSDIGANVGGNRYGMVAGTANGPYAPYETPGIGGRTITVGGDTQGQAGTLTGPTPLVTENQMTDAGIRKEEIQANLRDQLQFAAEKTGVEVEVGSGGQMSLAEARAAGARKVGDDWVLNGQKVRTGSTRHDDGGAADVKLYTTDPTTGKRRALDMSNPQDQATMAAFTRESVRAGAVGVGAGPGYMGNQTVHIGGGNAGYWGATQSGQSISAANAPKWVADAQKAGMADSQTGAAEFAAWQKERTAQVAAGQAVTQPTVSDQDFHAGHDNDNLGSYPIAAELRNLQTKVNDIGVMPSASEVRNMQQRLDGVGNMPSIASLQDMRSPQVDGVGSMPGSAAMEAFATPRLDPSNPLGVAPVPKFDPNNPLGVPGFDPKAAAMESLRQQLLTMQSGSVQSPTGMEAGGVVHPNLPNSGDTSQPGVGTARPVEGGNLGVDGADQGSSEPTTPTVTEPKFSPVDFQPPEQQGSNNAPEPKAFVDVPVLALTDVNTMDEVSMGMANGMETV